MDSVLVITSYGDIHAAAFEKRFHTLTNKKCHVFDVDTIATRDAISWIGRPTSEPHLLLKDNNGNQFDINDVSVIWWRRFNADPRIQHLNLSREDFDLIRNDCRAAAFGGLLTCFQGVWINHPVPTRNAENKLLQLHAAQSAGFRIPETLVSNCPDEIRGFCERLKNEAIVKYVRGTKYAALFTRKVSAQHLENDDSLRICPAIFQELIPGNAHLRIHCFGDAVFSVRITSQDLDWREDLEVPFEVVEIDEKTTRGLQHLLKTLDLRMGIVDLKITPDGEVVFLEINSQGQFLFSEGLSGFSLMDHFVRFIEAECRNTSSKHSA